MTKITGLSHLFKWENLHNWWLTKYFFLPHCVWQGLQTITDYKRKTSHVAVTDVLHPDKLNTSPALRITQCH